MLVRFLRNYRGIYLLATAAVLLVQIPLTLPEAFRIGTERYGREIWEGVKGAGGVEWIAGQWNRRFASGILARWLCSGWCGVLWNGGGAMDELKEFLDAVIGNRGEDEEEDDQE